MKDYKKWQFIFISYVLMWILRANCGKKKNLQCICFLANVFLSSSIGSRDNRKRKQSTDEMKNQYLRTKFFKWMAFYMYLILNFRPTFCFVHKSQLQSQQQQQQKHTQGQQKNVFNCSFIEKMNANFFLSLLNSSDAELLS